MNITSLFVTGLVLLVLAYISSKNDKLSREFLSKVRKLLITLAFICWSTGLIWIIYLQM